MVTARGAVPSPPARFVQAGQRPVVISSWAGPWPVDERWWAADARRAVRCQIVDVRGRAYLVTGTMGTDGNAGDNEPRWQVDAIYD